MITKEEYELIVKDINDKLEETATISDKHKQVISLLLEIWGEEESRFYETLDIRNYMNSPDKRITGSQRIDRFNKSIRDILDNK